MREEEIVWLTVVIFVLTYAGLALGKVPGLHMDRAGITLVGATLMLVTGLLSLEQAFSPESVDYRTLLLLFGMMIVVGFLRLSGFFQRLTGWCLRRIRTPSGLLVVTIALSGRLASVCPLLSTPPAACGLARMACQAASGCRDRLRTLQRMSNDGLA